MAIPGRHESVSIGGYRSLGSTQYFLLVVCVAAQIATLAITWPLWELREFPPHLPAVDLPQLPFGWLFALSLVVVLVLPRLGSRLYLAVLLVSFVFDQFRIQPQVIGIAILMIGVVEDRVREFARWYLVALWFWSGLNKLLSEDWLGRVSWGILDALSLESVALHNLFAYAVAFGEMATWTDGDPPPSLGGDCVRSVAHQHRRAAFTMGAPLELQRDPVEYLHGGRRRLVDMDVETVVSSNRSRLGDRGARVPFAGRVLPWLGRSLAGSCAVFRQRTPRIDYQRCPVDSHRGVGHIAGALSLLASIAAAILRADGQAQLEIAYRRSEAMD